MLSPLNTDINFVRKVFRDPENIDYSDMQPWSIVGIQAHFLLGQNLKDFPILLTLGPHIRWCITLIQTVGSSFALKFRKVKILSDYNKHIDEHQPIII